MRHRQAERNESNGGAESSPGELALLDRIRARAAKMRHGALRLGIGDDCALLKPRAGEELAVTTDLSIAGRHFRLDWHPPEAIGHRTLARGLSDLAAMGARPVAAFLSLGLPAELVGSKSGRKPRWTAQIGETWVDRFFDGFLALAETYKTPLAGGDLAESPIAVADIVLIGATARGKALLRAGARPGDLLYVTGCLGGAAAALDRLAAIAESAATRKNGWAQTAKIPQKSETELARHFYPQPRIAQGQWLARRGLATAALDLSDGLSTDLAHLCAESGVGAEVDSTAVPVHENATSAQTLHGGEDYELLFTAARDARIPASINGVPVTRIGRIVRRRTGRPMMTLLTPQGAVPLKARGWEHFSS